MATSLQDFISRLSAFGESFNDLTDILQEFGDEAAAEIKRAAPVDTGALKSSISAFATPNELVLRMLDYGIFQNYGVRGTESNPGAKTSESGFGSLSNRTFEFGSKMIGGNLPFGARVKIAKQGLTPKSFFSVAELTRELAQRVEQETINRL